MPPSQANGYAVPDPALAAQCATMLVYHMKHPDEPPYPSLCLRCDAAITSADYIACRVCHHDGPVFCEVRGGDTRQPSVASTAAAVDFAPP